LSTYERWSVQSSREALDESDLFPRYTLRNQLGRKGQYALYRRPERLVPQQNAVLLCVVSRACSPYSFGVWSKSELCSSPGPRTTVFALGERASEESCWILSNSRTAELNVAAINRL
jgi:hypothetical protein